MKNFILFSIILLLCIPFYGYSKEEVDKLTWPREIETEKEATITLYQPQLESFKDNVLIGRMAISIKPKDKDLVFGAAWFSARMITDLDQRITVLDELNITQTHFPDADEDKVESFARMLEEEIEGWEVEMSLDRLLASLELAEVQMEQSANLNNTPPEVYFRTSPATLVYIDGDPILKESEESGIEYVVNTPYFMVKDTKKGDFYFKGAKWWYTSKSAIKGWEYTKKVPNKIKKFADRMIDDEGMEQDSVLMAMEEAPELIISTVPAELVSTDGDPKYTPVEGTTLLYVDNTENDILMDINTQEHYILLAGRWYTSKTLEDGDWKFSEPSELPEEFAKIPAESPMGNVRTSVPGTDEANIAVLEQTIPQTATVDRKTATVEISWDGDPQFERIEGTDMSYGVNCDKNVLLVEGKYYCVDNGIWFESMKATGPYSVSTERPDGVEDIPAESPVYNVKYVYIYDSTPEVVYVGYTPGYTCSYVYGGVVVYGTGYYYRPWYGYYYYPRPVTYGYGVHYSPYSGWGFSFSISFGRHYSPYGAWGPRGYHRGYRHGYHHGHRHGYHQGYNRGYAQGARAGYNAGQRQSRNNVYNNRADGVRSTGVSQRQTAQNNANRAQAQPSTRQNQANTANRQSQNQSRAGTINQNVNNRSTQNARPSNQPNNVYSDKNGNVQRRDNNGNWENRSNGQWQQQQSGNRQNSQQMNRDYNSRQQGSQRQSNFNSSRSTQQRSTGTRSSGGSRPSGGARRR